MAAPPPDRPPRRSWYPATTLGCVLWGLALVLVTLLVGWLWAPTWWPWSW